MEHGFINLTPENIMDEHLCCIIRSRKPHPGVEAKRQWLAEGAMIAAQGYYQYIAGHTAGLELNGLPTLPIDYE